MSEGAYLKTRIRFRCVEEGECLLWQGALNAGCSPVIGFQGKNITIRRWLWQQMGKTIPKGRAVKVKCKQARCVAEDCLFLGYTGPETGYRHRTSTKAKIAAIRRAGSTLTMADVEEIRESSEPASVLAAKYGKGKTTIHTIRSGKSWRPVVTSMFAGLEARA